MRLIGKFIIIAILIGILLSASAYVILYTGEDNSDNTGQDTEPPQIDGITGDTTATAGENVTITALFSDNVNVTEATLYYKLAGSTMWTSESILSGSVNISIPSGTTSDYYYYVTVNDAVGNGPVGDPSADGSQYYIITVNSGGGNQNNETYTHTVFFEEATATWCTNCPNLANTLYSLYESDKYNFYYVALINGTNPDTKSRLWDDYNIWGFPTVFVDGGYKVVIGATNPQTTYIDAINAAQARSMPKIKVTVTTQYQNTTQEVTVNTVIENKGDASYNGRLKLYLTEIISHVSDYDSKPYHFGFLGYITNEDVSVDGKKSVTLTDIKDISAYDYENLMIIAVVFNSEKNQGYANPNDKTANLFDAYYADATNATRIVPKGNLPPQLQITSPQRGKIYLSGKPILERLQGTKLIGTLLHNRLYNKTILLLKKVITVNASDDSGIAKVEFSIDGLIMANDTEAPYEYSFTKLKRLKTLFFKEHTLTVTAYDDTGKTASASLVFKARI
jgi:hypothetical protein